MISFLCYDRDWVTVMTLLFFCFYSLRCTVLIACGLVSLLPIPWQPIPSPKNAQPRKLRIAYYTTFKDYLDASPACRRAVDEAVEKLRAAGHELVPFTPPRVDEAMSIFFALIASGGDHVQAELDGEKIADSLAKLSLQVRVCSW